MAKLLRNAKLLDRISVFFLAATGVMCLCYLILLILPPAWNPLAEPTFVPIAMAPTFTPSPTGPTPTPIPSATPTRAPTNTPVLGTPTPVPPSPTLRPTNTKIPTRTAPPTIGPPVTPSPTRSKYPFIAEIESKLTPYQCTWAGLFGGVYDLEGKPIRGYIVHIQGDADIDRTVMSGESQFSRVPGFDESIWDLPIDANGPTAGIWRVRLYKPGSNNPISEEYEIRLEAVCGASAYFIRFLQNH